MPVTLLPAPLDAKCYLHLWVPLLPPISWHLIIRYIYDVGELLIEIDHFIFNDGPLNGLFSAILKQIPQVQCLQNLWTAVATQRHL